MTHRSFPLQFMIVSLAAVLAIGGAAAGSEERRQPAKQSIRGVTIGPIEHARHADRGYGTERSREAVALVHRLDANWVSITPFGRVWNLQSQAIDLTFEQPFLQNRAAIRRQIEQAHAAGLKVMLVPHLWVESGQWRAHIDPGDDKSWAAWSAAYQRFVLTWAELAEEAGAELFSVGVELRSWVTTTRAPSFLRVIQAVRDVYRGPLTYAANWDDIEQTVIWGELDIIGVNAFYPLAPNAGAQLPQLQAQSATLAKRLASFASQWRKPILFTEMGYTTRSNPTLRPWEWPDDMHDVVVDEVAQAEAYTALLSGFVDQPWFLGFFAWRIYADPYDVSQEAAWGFSPLHKQAELALRDAFTTRWARDAQLGHWLEFELSADPLMPHANLTPSRAQAIGKY